MAPHVQTAVDLAGKCAMMEEGVWTRTCGVWQTVNVFL